jgi:SprT protein
VANPKERYKVVLARYIPPQTVDIMAEWILEFNFNLKITESRNTKLGDYRAPIHMKRHFITINHNLNKYAFLITLVHEIAHLTTWNKFKDRVKPHGLQWKDEYKRLMLTFMNREIFPPDVELALKKYMFNPAASSCSDDNLLRVLKKYDNDPSSIYLEEIPDNALFLYNEKRCFRKGERLRKRYKCKEVSTNVVYLFNPLTEVKLVEPQLS